MSRILLLKEIFTGVDVDFGQEELYCRTRQGNDLNCRERCQPETVTLISNSRRRRAVAAPEVRPAQRSCIRALKNNPVVRRFPKNTVPLPDLAMRSFRNQHGNLSWR